ncbi:hypothetical protein DPSP01_001300 [Paraphaeosphaeria sporulosa]|uniref:Serine-threonine protein kinase 19 n=1 Tax=Paraphaeosphaeria sporulosa TaxID=1460663 RepID=A0A177C1K8_9PLEO|nr:uncharacterized protein CC84DRAFT_1180509 [Paraphaeosphaeria sporulosa]OAG00500.1 hypothetical protein CC84DRAFT_1180509 [Paraphaeosphaeria sporulosa]
MQTTPARSSRITKSRKPSVAAALGLRRSVSSPSSGSPRRKSAQSVKSENFDYDDKLDDTGVIASLAADLNFRDVPQYMEYIRSRMFSDIPLRNSGLNSTRIAETLNYRKALPPIVTLAHLDALGTSSTRTEREIAELSQAGILRRIAIPNRGTGIASVGDGIASVQEWGRLVRSHTGLTPEVQSKYLTAMHANPTSTIVASTAFTPGEISSLSAAGFLTTSTAPESRSSLFAMPGTGSLSALSTAGSRHASGSIGAVGGASATQHMHGGTGQRMVSTTYYNFSLPNTGSHTKLIVEARTHFLSLLKRSKYREAPLDLLRERWDGGILGKEEIADKKKARGEFAGILPGRTKKWKQFHGLRFEWILEECVGAGLVELFETGSVGKAARIL